MGVKEPRRLKKALQVALEFLKSHGVELLVDGKKGWVLVPEKDKRGVVVNGNFPVRFGSSDEVRVLHTGLQRPTKKCFAKCICGRRRGGNRFVGAVLVLEGLHPVFLVSLLIHELVHAYLWLAGNCKVTKSSKKYLNAWR
eukprot:Trichotokara_eunicae@DN10533_c0_g1_i1.p1